MIMYSTEMKPGFIAYPHLSRPSKITWRIQASPGLGNHLTPKKLKETHIKPIFTIRHRYSIFYGDSGNAHEGRKVAFTTGRPLKMSKQSQIPRRPLIDTQIKSQIIAPVYDRPACEYSSAKTGDGSGYLRRMMARIGSLSA